MGKSFIGGATAVLAVAFVCLAPPPARAAEGDSGGVLKKHGLRIAGSLAVVPEEAAFKSKLSETRRLAKQLSYSIMQQQATLGPNELKQNMKNLTDQISQLRSAMTAASQQLNSIPRYRGRFMSNDASQLYSQLVGYRTELQMEIDQDSRFLNQLKSQPADPKAKEKIDAEVRDRRDSYHQALLDLRKLVDSVHEKYDALAKDDEVKKALEIAGHGLREKPRLGPAHDFLTNVKLLEKMETAESGGDNETSHAKSKRLRHGTRIKNSSKAATDAVSGKSEDSDVSP